MPMFGIGGLTGIPLALPPADLYLHDTYYIIAHFHYLVAPGTIFALFAATYYWFPKAYRKNDERILGQSAFLAHTHLHERDFPPDVSPRDARHASALVRWWPGHGVAGDHTVWGLTGFRWNQPISWAAWIMALAQIPFHHEFLLEHQARQKSQRQSVGSHHAGVDRAYAAAARKFYEADHCVSRTRTITAFAGRSRIFARRTRPLLRQRKKRPSPDRSVKLPTEAGATQPR